jgi:hypothetical protein
MYARAWVCVDYFEYILLVSMAPYHLVLVVCLTELGIFCVDVIVLYAFILIFVCVYLYFWLSVLGWLVIFFLLLYISKFLHIGAFDAVSQFSGNWFYVMLLYHRLELWILSSVWAIVDFLSPFLFANCTNASTFSKWCDGRRSRERGIHQHPSAINGAKPGVEVGNRNIYKLTN